MIYPHFDYIAFGRALVEYREDNHLTRQAMAGMARIKADKLRRLEHGQLPDVETFGVLCSLMNLTPNEFFNMVVYPDNRMNIAPMWDTDARYRKMLYEMTSLTDWQQAGYDPAEYAALVEEFEGKPDHA